MYLCESINLCRYECKNVIMHFAKHLSSLKSKMNIKIIRNLHEYGSNIDYC